MDMATLRHSKSASAQTGRAAAGIISRLVRVRVRVRVRGRVRGRVSVSVSVSVRVRG